MTGAFLWQAAERSPGGPVESSEQCDSGNASRGPGEVRVRLEALGDVGAAHTRSMEAASQAASWLLSGISLGDS